MKKSEKYLHPWKDNSSGHVIEHGGIETRTAIAAQIMQGLATGFASDPENFRLDGKPRLVLIRRFARVAKIMTDELLTELSKGE